MFCVFDWSDFVNNNMPRKNFSDIESMDESLSAPQVPESQEGDDTTKLTATTTTITTTTVAENRSIFFEGPAGPAGTSPAPFALFLIFRALSVYNCHVI